MEVVKFLEERTRMCKAYACSECPLGEIKGSIDTCGDILYKYPEKAVAIVEQWAKEHPLRTYAKDFFEKFPNTAKDYNGLPLLCKRHVYGGECTYNCPACWNSPMEEYND